MDENQTTTEGFEFEVPGVETEAATETPEVETPQYVTKDDMAAFAQQIVEGLKTATVNTPTPQVPTVPTDQLYTEVADQFYDNPAEAFKRIAEHTRETVLKELAPALGAIYGDYNTRAATSGFSPEEAEYVQDLVTKGYVNADTMKDPGLRDVVQRAAKQYASEKVPTRAPSAEGAVGAPANFGHVDPTVKAAFESAFGMKIEHAIKKAGF